MEPSILQKCCEYPLSLPFESSLTCAWPLFQEIPHSAIGCWSCSVRKSFPSEICKVYTVQCSVLSFDLTQWVNPIIVTCKWFCMILSVGRTESTTVLFLFSENKKSPYTSEPTDGALVQWNNNNNKNACCSKGCLNNPGNKAKENNWIIYLVLPLLQKLAGGLPEFLLALEMKTN